jgi:hypothetical protein
MRSWAGAKDPKTPEKNTKKEEKEEQKGRLTISPSTDFTIGQQSIPIKT